MSILTGTTAAVGAAPTAQRRGTAAYSKSFKSELREQLRLAEPAWQRCLGQVPANDRPDKGGVRIRFILAHAQPGEDAGASGVRVELSEVDDDESSIADVGFRRCLQTTPHAMSFGPLPEGVDAVAVGFRVNVESGTIGVADGRSFSYLRDTDAPMQR